ncbi:MAG TPA: RDD family protein [Pyrinomonadaceae bacterium]|nr:RDD family protein [Pyrinomonadaceae bacterium]
MDNLVSEKPFASIIQRLIAYAVDALLLFVVIGLLLGGIFGLILYLTVGFEWTPNGFLLWAYVFATLSIPCWLYYAIFESSERQATMGMRLLGLRVTGLNGERISFGRALLRTVVKLIPFEVNHAVMFLPVPLMNETNPNFRYGFILVNMLMLVYLASVVLTSRRQSIHDLIAGTMVVRDR